MAGEMSSALASWAEKIFSPRGTAQKAAENGTAAPNVPPTKAVPMVGQFEMMDTVLGEGGYAKVVLGRNTETNEPVAIKLLDTRRDVLSSSGRAVSSEPAIVREVAALRRAGVHPNVCQLHGYYRLGEGGACHAMVMELCRGGELFKLVERYGALDEVKIRPIFLGVLAGLEHLHAQGIAHRDLKLENILLAQPPAGAKPADGGRPAVVPKIADLGLAHVHARGADGEGWAERELTQFCGSRSYCAPEVMARLGYNGYLADVWSLGVCLFGLVSGFFPVDEASSRDWRYERLARQQHAQPDASTAAAIYGFYNRPCPLSPALVHLLDRMLLISPARRATLSEVSASQWVRGETQLAAPPTRAEPQPMMDFDAEVEVDVSDYLQRSGADFAAAESQQYRSIGAPPAADGAPESAPPPLCRQRAEASVGVAAA